MNDSIQRFNVGRRLAFALGTLIVLAGLLVAAGIASITSARSDLDQIVKVSVVKTKINNDMLNSSANVLVALGTLSTLLHPCCATGIST